MVHSSFIDGWSTAARTQLCDLAVDAIVAAAKEARELAIRVQDCERELQQPGACFVTLLKSGELRGCIGSLEAWRPLAQDVVANAYAACRNDPRFMPVTAPELASMSAEISVLSPLRPLPVASQQQLLDVLRPFEDGLVIEDGLHRATFLPSVWDQLPDKEDFLLHLKLKAGMQTDHWPAAMKCFRYTTDKLHIASIPAA